VRPALDLGLGDGADDRDAVGTCGYDLRVALHGDAGHHHQQERGGCPDGGEADGVGEPCLVSVA